MQTRNSSDTSISASAATRRRARASYSETLTAMVCSRFGAIIHPAATTGPQSAMPRPQARRIPGLSQSAWGSSLPGGVGDGGEGNGWPYTKGQSLRRESNDSPLWPCAKWQRITSHRPHSSAMAAFLFFVAARLAKKSFLNLWIFMP